MLSLHRVGDARVDTGYENYDKGKLFSPLIIKAR